MDYTIIPYLILFLLEIGFFANVKHNRGKQQVCFWVLFIQFFIIFAFRAPTVLADTDSYYKHFNQVNEFLPIGIFGGRERFERGYLLYEQLIHNFVSDNFLVFQIITTAIILGGTMWFLYKKSKCTWMVLFLYVISRFMIGEVIATRQGIAIVIALWSFPYLERKQYIKYSIGIIFAYFFHSSAVAMLLLIPLYVDYLSYRMKIIVLCAGTLVLFVGYSYFINTYIEGVYGSTNKVSGVNPIGIFASANALALFVYASYIGDRKRKKITGKNWNELMIISLLYLLVSVLTIRLWIFTRLALYFFPFMIIYISNLYAVSSKATRYRVATCCLALFLTATLLFIFSYRPEWVRIFPYSFYS